MNPLRHCFAAALAAMSLAAPPGAAAHEGPHKEGSAPSIQSATRVKLVDAPLLTHEGKPLRLTDATLASRILVVDFVYTSCTTFCPVASALMDQVRTRLGARVGRDVQLLTITVDPVRDTPARLAEYGGRFGASPGWTWLTGRKPDVDAVLRGLGAYSRNFEDHPAVVLVGDPATGRWTRLNGLPDPELVVRRVELARADGARP